MKIGLIDVDGHNFPNLPLMKLSAYHKKRGDVVKWYEPFDGLVEKYDRVYMSKVFSFSHDYEYPIYSDEVIKGGSGYCIELENGKEVFHAERDRQLPPEIEHIYPDYEIYGDLTKETAFGMMSRGCPRGCGFCHVKAKEGARSYKVADLSEFWHGQKNIVLLDPNILACPDHLQLLQQLFDSGARVELNQGIDARLLTDANTEMLKRIRLQNIHFAFDRYQDKDIIVPRLEKFVAETGYNKDKGHCMCYILVNYDTTIEQDIERIQICRELKISPFPMIYDKEHCNPIYKKLQRWCNNWIFWQTPTFDDYVGNYKQNRGIAGHSFII